MATVRGFARVGLLGAVLLGTWAVAAQGQTRESLSSLHLVVNVPAARLDVSERMVFGPGAIP